MAATSLEAADALVSVTMHYSANTTGPSARGSKVITKKLKLTKSDNIPIDASSTRVAFVAAFLGVHDLSEMYSAGVHSGPNFKLYWTGSRSV